MRVNDAVPLCRGFCEDRRKPDDSLNEPRKRLKVDWRKALLAKTWMLGMQDAIKLTPASIRLQYTDTVTVSRGASGYCNLSWMD